LYKKSFYESHYRKNIPAELHLTNITLSCQRCSLIRVLISFETVETYFSDYLAVVKFAEENSRAAAESFHRMTKTQSTESKYELKTCLGIYSSQHLRKGLAY
jgi:hypothetical protein